MHNEAHTALVRDALEQLAINGYTAWKSGAGGYETETGAFIKYGKKGGGDITIILPLRIGLRTFGLHVEAEAKTGKAVQRKNQKLHQKFVVERNGGVYILFRSTNELLERLKQI